MSFLKKNTIENFFNSPLYLVLLLFITGCAVRFYMSFFQNHIFLYTDEILFLEAARSLADFESISVRGVPHFYPYLLYPAIIAPSQWIADAQTSFGILKAINAFIMNISVFPAYFLAKKITPKHALLVAAVSLLIPEMCLSNCVFAEVLTYPLSLCFFLFAYDWLKGGKKQAVFLTLAFGLALAFTKAVSLYFLTGLIIYATVSFFIRGNLKRKILTGAAAIAVILCFILFANHIFIGYTFNFSYFLNFDRISAILRYSLYFLAYLSAGAGFYFIFFPLCFRSDLEKNIRRFASVLYVILLTGIITVVFMVSMVEDYPSSAMTPHLRYLFPLIIPFFIVFLSIEKWKISVLSKYAVLLFVIFMQWGIVRFPESNYPAFMNIAYLRESLLFPFFQWNVGDLKIKGSMFDIVKILILAVTLYSSYLIIKEKYKIFRIFATSLFIALCLVNNILCYNAGLKTIYPNSRYIISQIDLINQYIKGSKALVIGKYAASEKIFETYSKQKYWFTTATLFEKYMDGTFSPRKKTPLIGMQWATQTDPQKAKVSKWIKLDEAVEVADPVFTNINPDYIIVRSNISDLRLSSKNLKPAFIPGLTFYRVYKVIY